MENRQKPVYKIVDSKGRIHIPKAMRDSTEIEAGDIVRLGMVSGRLVVQKTLLVEQGDKSPEALEAYIRAGIQRLPDSAKIILIGSLSTLLEQKG